MEYDPKILPENINTSEEHPLREFVFLAGGIAAIIFVIISLLALSTDYLIQFIPLDKESEWFSASLFEQQENSPQKDSTNPVKTEIEQYLFSLVQQLNTRDPPRPSFTTHLVDNQTPNAFIIPGGHIFVTTGLLRNVKSENGLAMVLAHEMGHQYKRHPLRSAGRGLVIGLALFIISGTDNSGLAQGFVENTASLTNLGFSREQEREADAIGLELLMKHYGHTRGADEFFESIQNQPELDSDIPAFISTHPAVEERIATLQKYASNPETPLVPLPSFIDDYLKQLGNQYDGIQINP